MLEQILIAKDIYIGIIIGKDDVEALENNILLLFKRFKRAYENKDLNALEDTISDNFFGNYYGAKTKRQFLELTRKVFETMPSFINPHLVIVISNITINSQNQFMATIELKAVIKVLLLPIPWKYDSGKVICQAKPEGNLEYWRITSLVKSK
jgi:hypothetical protein